MRRKKEDAPPTRIYTYGALAPIEGADLVEEQFWLAHRYYNALIEVERSRRGAVRAIMSEIGDLAEIEQRIEELETNLARFRHATKHKRSQARRRVPVEPETKAKMAAVQEALKAAREERKTVKAALLKEPEIIEQIKGCNERANIWKRGLRAACGVYWGTYLMVEKAAEAAAGAKMDPKFKRWDGRGKVGVQIQKSKPLSSGDLFGDDTRIRIDPTPRQRVTKRHPEGKLVKNSATLRLRVGSDKKKKPIWASFPIIMHRPLPEDSDIKWAWVRRERVGTRWRWKFQLAIEARSFVKLPKLSGPVCGIDIGWRNRGTNGLRVGYLVDTFGRTEEIAMARVIADKLQHVDSLKSIIDKGFDQIRARLGSWLADNEVPDWLRKELRYLAQWKAPRKLVRVVHMWRKARFEGDEVMFAELDGSVHRDPEDRRGAWCYHNRHLYQWKSSEENKTLMRRREEYRQIATRIACTYSTIIIEDLNLSELALLPLPEEEPALHSAARRQRVMAAPSEFRDAILLAASNTGAQIVKVPAPYTTLTCHSCREVCEWDVAEELYHTCEHCGIRWDQDENAARNLLHAHLGSRGPVLPKDPGPLDSQRLQGGGSGIRTRTPLGTSSMLTRARTARDQRLRSALETATSRPR